MQTCLAGISRTIIFFFILCGGSLVAQTGDTILGINSAGMDYYFNSMDIPSQTVSNLNIIGPLPVLQGQSTYDRINKRYFERFGNHLYMIDAASGNTLDTLDNVSNMINYEYDEKANAIVALQTSPARLVSVDLTTKVKTVLAPLPNNSASYGESTFDRVNRAYIYNSNAGITVLDSTGIATNIVNTNLSSIEYDPQLNTVFGFRRVGSLFIFAGVDLGTGMTADLCSLQISSSFYGGESTFDEINHRYFAASVSGIWVFDALGDTLIGNIPPGKTLTGIEYANFVPVVVDTVTAPTGLKINAGKDLYFSVFPNPGPGYFTFNNLENGNKIEIFDATGKLISASIVNDVSFNLNLEGREKGIYLYRIIDTKSNVRQGKLVIK